MQLPLVLSLLIVCTVVSAEVRLGKYNPKAKSVLFNLPTTNKRGLAAPFVFTYRTSTTQAVKDCFEHAGNTVLASRLLTFSVNNTSILGRFSFFYPLLLGLINFSQQITVAVTWAVLDPFVLGSCRPSGSCYVQSTSTWYPSVLYDSILG